ncbi:DUF4174 domain-containing protein [Tianweitania sediminis]|uniref:DUF4174 domain-containing protein n=1 Tax=Tianweitania sediminis TaxID=1502156 RepID=A0A8J7REZ0_9HYPH|nr:DUF4174 domain-containing protein [Tianweitania sediminis]MBP0437246.1 DUF4174 domain-containing protein [Tianweitania sediminis]
MLRVLLAGSLLVAALPISGAFADPGPLAAYQWKKRVLLIFGEEAEVAQQDGRFAEQQSQANERDLVVLSIVGNLVADGVSRERLPTASALRTRFRVDENADLTVVLVGKDGGEKLRETELIEPETVFDLIDSMPMRRSEMRDG